MQGILNNLVDHNQIIPVLAISGGLMVAMIWIIAATWHAIATARGRETTRREIAAYVAEGSIEPKVAIALLQETGDSSTEAAEALAAAGIVIGKA